MIGKHFVGVALIYGSLVKGVKTLCGCCTHIWIIGEMIKNTFCGCCTHIWTIGEMMKKQFVGVALINVSTHGGCCTHKCIR